MGRRYYFLGKEDIYQSYNRLRAALLAARDGEEVDDIMFGLMTEDERIKLGRRVAIARMISDGMTIREIADELKVGLTTVNLISRKMQQHPNCYRLIFAREEKVESEYERKAYEATGGSMKVWKRKKYTGFTRKQVKR